MSKLYVVDYGELPTKKIKFIVGNNPYTFNQNLKDIYIDMVRYDNLPILSFNGVSQTPIQTKTSDSHIKEAIFYINSVSVGDIINFTGYANIYALEE